jgi:B12-binding domain/radical SAM domain protein
VPNLTWKRGGEVRETELTHVPADLDGVSFDYRAVIRSCAKHLDVIGHLPFKAWLGYPILAALTCHGCTRDCVICGGSASAYRDVCGRASLAPRSPELVARDIGTMSRFVKAPVMVLGGVLQAGKGYAMDFLRALAAERVRNHIAFEFFTPPPRDVLDALAAAAPNFNIQISPESHDEGVRGSFGKKYDNAALELSILGALEVGCRRLDVFFMIGLPGQTPESVLGTVAYCGELLEKCDRAGFEGRLLPFISPLSPFLDPGSPAFVEPERHGYRLFHRTLEEHRRALAAPSWKYTLNYETQWMTRDQLVEVTYEAALELNRIKRAHQLLTENQARRINERISRERELMHEIDRLCAEGAGPDREARLEELMRRFRAVGPATICSKTEMNWPARFVRFNPLGMVRSALEGILRR